MSRAALCLVGALAALAACGDPSGPRGEPGIRILAGDGVTDTVLAKPLQALVVEVRDDRGLVRPNTQVIFRGLLAETGSAQPTAYISRLEGSYFEQAILDTTDARGRVSVRVQLGRLAGAAGVSVAVPDLGTADTAHFTVAPGAVARVVSLPADTALLPGRSYALLSTVTDRFGNARPDVPTYTAGPAGISVSGGAVTTQSLARSWVIVQVGGHADTSYVSVVPDATLAARTGSAIATFRTDGSGLTALTSAAGAGNVTDWSPDGTEIVFEGNVGSLLVVNAASGAVRTLSMSPSMHGRFSPDGGTIYYSWLGLHLYRQARDGTDDGPVPMTAPSIDEHPSPSPDGTRLAYVATSYTSPLPDLRVLTLSSGASTSLNVAGESPSWSPSGARIAFLDAYTGELTLVGADGAGVRVLTPGARYAGGIDWSPDGRWLVARNAGTRTLDLIDTESTLVLPLAFTLGWSAPSWKP